MKYKLIHMPTLTEHNRMCSDYSRLYVENTLTKTNVIYLFDEKNQFSFNPYPKEYAKECKTSPKSFMWVEVEDGI